MVGGDLNFFSLVESMGVEGEEAMAPFGLLFSCCLHGGALLQNCNRYQVLGIFIPMPVQEVLTHLAEVSVVLVVALVVGPA